jgi:hypothetical protein
MSLDIEKFNPTVAELQRLVEESKSLTVSDFGDAEQIRAVKKHRLVLRDARVAITKTGKSLREDALKFQKAVIEKEKELVAIVEPEEERLQAFEDKAAALVEVKRREALLPARKAKLDEIKDGIEALDDQLLTMDDEAFNTYYNGRIYEKNRKDREALEARERAVKEEEDRQRREKEKAEAEERGRQQERERQEQRKKEEAERAEKEKSEAADRERREYEAKQKARIDRVTALGLTWLADQQSYVLEDFNVGMVDIKTLTDEQFDHIIKGIQAEMKKRREAKEEAERARVEKERLEKEERYQMFLSTHGYNDDTKDNFIIQNTPSGVELYKKVGEFRK